jgi:hypothetical protein
LRGHGAAARSAIDLARSAAAETQDLALTDACAAAARETGHA